MRCCDETQEHVDDWNRDDMANGGAYTKVSPIPSSDRSGAACLVSCVQGERKGLTAFANIRDACHTLVKGRDYVYTTCVDK